MTLNSGIYYDLTREVVALSYRNQEPMVRFLLSGKQPLVLLKNLIDTAHTVSFFNNFHNHRYLRFPFCLLRVNFADGNVWIDIDLKHPYMERIVRWILSSIEKVGINTSSFPTEFKNLLFNNPNFKKLALNRCDILIAKQFLKSKKFDYIKVDSYTFSKLNDVRIDTKELELCNSSLENILKTRLIKTDSLVISETEQTFSDDLFTIKINKSIRVVTGSGMETASPKYHGSESRFEFRPTQIQGCRATPPPQGVLERNENAFNVEDRTNPSAADPQRTRKGQSFVSSLKILQLTDFHYDVNYDLKGEPSEMCHLNTSDTSPKTIGFYGNYKCDSPKSLIKHALTHAKTIIPDPTLILWTGDNVPHVEDYDNNYTVSAIETTTNLISFFFNTTLVLPIFGNHDYAPANDFPDKENTIYSKTFDMWKKWIGKNQNETFLKAGYYVYKFNTNVTFLMLNTNLYYRFNSANFTDKTDPGGQFAFMEKVLSEAEASNTVVHVIAHIPPGVFERTPNFTWMPNMYNKKILEITVKYSKTIKWMIFGHHHTDTFHIIKDKDGNPVQLMLMAPAVTPWFSTLKGAGSNNPAFRIIEYDEKTWDFTDIKTYYINLDDLNKNASTDWSLEYSMKNEYNLDSINPTSMNSLLQKMKIDNALFQKYINYNSVQWNPKMPEGQFRAAQFCSIEFPDLDDYSNCMASGSTSDEIILTFLSFSVFILFI